MQRMLFVAIVLIASYASLSAPISLPEGWKHPSDSTFRQSWRNSSRSKYLGLGADLNGDKLIDSAFILEPINGNGIGIFAFLSQQNGSYVCICIYDSQKDSANIGKMDEEKKAKIQRIYRQVYGIRIVKPGSYKTACGKGYYDCEKDEPEEIKLENSAIDFFQSEGANSFYYWDIHKKLFARIWMSD